MGLIGSALGAVGSIFGGISASKAMKKVQQNLEQQQREAADLYNRRYNEDYTQRADAQRILNMTEQAIKNRNRAAAATQAVMGGTDESVAAEKAANAGAMADTASRIAAAGANRQDEVESQYQNTKANLNNQLNQAQQWKAGQIAQAAGQLVKAGGQMDFGKGKLFGKEFSL